jgi:hypothetical protein
VARILSLTYAATAVLISIPSIASALLALRDYTIAIRGLTKHQGVWELRSQGHEQSTESTSNIGPLYTVATNALALFIKELGIMGRPIHIFRTCRTGTQVSQDIINSYIDNTY